MSTQRQTGESRPASLPDELRSPRAKLVYLYLNGARTATIEELQDGLGLKKITLYSILRTLRERGLIEKGVDGYLCRPDQAK